MEVVITKPFKVRATRKIFREKKILESMLIELIFH